MHPPFRAIFNRAYEPPLFEAYTRLLRAEVGDVGFRLAETPVFFDADLIRRCEGAAIEIVEQLGDPARAAAMTRFVPKRFAAGDAMVLPQCAVVDFAIARDSSGLLVPKVVELQGFPSLYGFETMQGDAWMNVLAPLFPGVTWSSWFGDLNRASYLELLKRTILGEHDPQNVVLLDLEPAKQKTSCDFRAMHALCGIDALDPRELQVRSGRVYRRDADGRERRVERIYNRIVGDDLSRLAAEGVPVLDMTLDVVWAPHPRWFWLWSKASMPFLSHSAVPETQLLSDIETLPADLREHYVLKPLFSFAGSGVNVHPTEAACAAVPQEQRDFWCLQEKIPYARALETPDDGVKTEIRVMLLRPDDAAALVPATNLCRLSRGDMHGVDHNKGMAWTGSSIGLWTEARA